MITEVKNDDIFNTDLKHVAFAVNTEGYNDSGFAGAVTSKFAPELASTGGNHLGEVLTSTTKDGKSFHGLVCHSLKGEGWSKAPETITKCLNAIETGESEKIAVILMGGGMIGQMSGANLLANIKAIHASEKSCVVYTLEYTEQAVWDVIK